METLEMNIQNLKTKIAEMESSIGNNKPDFSGSVQDLEKMRERLDGLERSIPEVHADLRRCCQQLSDLDLSVIYQNQLRKDDEKLNY